MHHGNLLASRLKRFLLGFLLLELLCPNAFEVDGVQQIADSIRVELRLTEHLFYHLLRMVAGPLVDNVHCLTISEVARLRLGIVEIVGLLNKDGVQRVVFVHVDVVCYLHLRQLVQMGSFRQHLFAKGIYFISIVETQNLVDLL